MIKTNTSVVFYLVSVTDSQTQYDHVLIIDTQVKNMTLKLIVKEHIYEHTLVSTMEDDQANTSLCLVSVATVMALLEVIDNF